MGQIYLSSQFIINRAVSLSLFLTVVCFIPTAHAYGKACMAVFDTDPWSPQRFTDPVTYKAGQEFRFIAHAVRKLALLEAIFPDKGEINLLKHPNLIANIPTLSASVISQNRSTTWSNSGFILEVPSENILEAKPYDVFTRNWANDGQHRSSRPHSFSPGGLLRATSPAAYNEVVVQGTSSNGSKIRVNGIFIKTDRMNKPVSTAARVRALKAIAKQYHLPIVYIPDVHTDNPGDNAKMRSPHNIRDLLDKEDIAP